MEFHEVKLPTQIAQRCSLPAWRPAVQIAQKWHGSHAWSFAKQPAWRPAVQIFRFLLCKNLKLKNGTEAIFEQRKG
jgi:hypothetical protein